jgi:hypothetical protein
VTHSHRARCEYQRLAFATIECHQFGTEDRDGTPICADHADLYDLTFAV